MLVAYLEAYHFVLSNSNNGLWWLVTFQGLIYKSSFSVLDKAAFGPKLMIFPTFSSRHPQCPCSEPFSSVVDVVAGLDFVFS